MTRSLPLPLAGELPIPPLTLARRSSPTRAVSLKSLRLTLAFLPPPGPANESLPMEPATMLSKSKPPLRLAMEEDEVEESGLKGGEDSK